MFGRSKHREKKVTSLQGYIGEISSIREQWLANPDDELWFRGEDDKHRHTTLLPELYRTDKPTDKVLEMESRLFDEFKRCGVQYSEFNTEDEWNWYYAMQHYSGPTRLIDWSDGSLMAAHFSMRSKVGTRDLENDSVVYVLDPHWLVELIDELPAAKKRREIWDKKPKTGQIDEDDRDGEYENIWLPGAKEDFDEDPLPEHPFLLDTEQITRRVASQRSRFMVFGADREFLRKLAQDGDARIRRLVFPGKSIPKIQDDIRDCGVTESVIFPDLDGVGRETRQRWQQFKARA
jgi:hypothetical protein